MIELPMKINGKSLYNRVVLQPMEGCDCNTDGSPSGKNTSGRRKAGQDLFGLRPMPFAPKGGRIPGR